MKNGETKKKIKIVKLKLKGVLIFVFFNVIKISLDKLVTRTLTPLV
jgi:hypothetical protein